MTRGHAERSDEAAGDRPSQRTLVVIPTYNERENLPLILGRVRQAKPEAHVLVMAAAVADFRPAQIAPAKIKKGSAAPPTIDLVRNDDVLAGAVRARTDGQLPNMAAIVGFAAETGDANGDVLFHARAKLRRKGCDLLVVNAVGEGKAFEVDHNDGWLLAADGAESALEHGSKTLMASRIVDAIVTFLHGHSG
ncbi:Coenzyme A biosynthesis bifunctional protein CoaBC [Mycobacterium talmoniae]|uniref:Coenzyme A biosynthesis bifunctional protein CoaBC n=1 Tax=Mycobacterium talmoniae TaxID=1858794 RepID=A0A2S8BQE3_9MYCO|nr:Coenzyme A biosynthesis bifunctional protein CoaBC [Mycobacterium talmoniae]